MTCFDTAKDVPALAAPSQESLKYRMYSDQKRPELRWLVGETPAAGDYVYCVDPVDPNGFGGAELTFEVLWEEGPDITRRFHFRGPWHSNASALYWATGVDVRKKCQHFLVIAKERTYVNGRTVLLDVVYRDTKWHLDDENGYLWQLHLEFLKLHRGPGGYPYPTSAPADTDTLAYFCATAGGSHSGAITWEGLRERMKSRGLLPEKPAEALTLYYPRDEVLELITADAGKRLDPVQSVELNESGCAFARGIKRPAAR